jgi:acyl phosphate:glycerol-3-phosphate acyltransferase
VIDVHDEHPRTASRRRPQGLPAPVVVGAAWLAGSVPFSNVAARHRADVDLRDVGTGTVSGTALYDVAGFGPLAVAGVCDVAKGAVGPLLAGRDRPVLGAVAATAGVAGHNWSPWLRGAGGRGLSVALGAFLPLAWPGTVVLALGLAGGRLRRQTGLGTFIAAALVVPVVARTHGRSGAIAGAGIVGALLAKRMTGNRPPARRTAAVYLHRLVFDHDPGGGAGSVSERSERTISPMHRSARTADRSLRASRKVRQ